MNQPQRTQNPGLLDMVRRMVPGYSGEAVDQRIARGLEDQGVPANIPQAAPAVVPQQQPVQTVPQNPVFQGIARAAQNPIGLLEQLRKLQEYAAQQQQQR